MKLRFAPLIGTLPFGQQMGASMENNYYLAIDIGASSGRHVLGFIDETGKIAMEEVYRFSNGLNKKNGHLCWDFEQLFFHIKEGMKCCKEISKIPVSMGVDTWGVDFVLLDCDGEVIGDTIGYRDRRTERMAEEVQKIISMEDLYTRTGIQKQKYNTIYQLMAIRLNDPEMLARAKHLLMVPEYFNYLLTGHKVNEYTNATTTQLVRLETNDWDFDLIELLGIPTDMFGKLSMPGTVVGRLTKEVKEEIGYDLEVVLPATHDTASAVMAVPANDNDFIYISSGTWSLIGIERKETDSGSRSREANFTNEGGYEYRYRFIKNIMGLWMIQSLRHELDDKYSFAELCEMAEGVSDFDTVLDVNSDDFLSPDSMILAIQSYCMDTNQKIPESPGEFAYVIYHSLAKSYAAAVKEIEEIAGRSFSRIHIVGGGSNAEYLNHLTKIYTGKEVYAGPTEATAIGNLLAQMIKYGGFTSIENARDSVFDSFDIKEV